MNSQLSNILATGVIVGASGESVKVHSAIPREEGLFLQDVIKRIRPKMSLEVGLAMGVSTLFICDALREVGAVKHVCVDPHQFGVPETDLFHSEMRDGWTGLGMHVVGAAGFNDLVDLRNEPSHFALPKLLREGYKIEFAFIDGWHTFDYAMLDFFYVDKMLAPGGVVVFDDTLYPSVRKLCRYIVTNLPYRTYPEPGSGPRPNTRPKSFIEKVLSPETIESDARLGLPNRNYIAFRKERNDYLGLGENGTRRWDHHFAF